MRPPHPLVLSVVGVVWLAGCASRPEPQIAAGPADTVRVVDTVVVTAQDASLRQEVAALQLKVLERDAQLGDLRRQLDATRLEVVRAMAKLQSTASRAEAASAMAEAEVALRQLRGAAQGSSADLDEAQRLLSQSNTQFEEQNHGGALYLATEAKRIAVIRRHASVGDDRQPGEVPFAAPLSIKTLTRSNVRDGPGTDFNILFTLEQDAPLHAFSYVEEWLRVTDADGREGWIYRTLVGGQME